VAGFFGLAYEWWRWLPTETKHEILNAEDADMQVLQALSTQFYCSADHQDLEHLASIYMSQRLCDISMHEKYFCDIQRLLIESGHADDPSYLKYYLRSFPGAIPDSVEQFFKDKQLKLQGMSLAQLHAFIIQVWQEHCLEKRVSKDFKRFDSMFTGPFCKNLAKMPNYGCGSHNRGHQSEKCSCSHKKNRRSDKYSSKYPNHYSRKHQYNTPSRFGSNKPRKDYGDKKHHSKKHFQKRRFLHKRKSPSSSEKCFIRGKKGHWANECPQKKKHPQLSALFTNEFDPAWWDLEYGDPSSFSEGVIVYLPDDEASDFDSDASSNSSSDVTTLGGCKCPQSSLSSLSSSEDEDNFEYRPPPFLGMLSNFHSPKVSDTERLEQIEGELSKLEPYKYQQRTALRNEKNALIQRLKGKSPLVDSPSPSPKLIAASMLGYYTPTELFREHPDSHRDRQSFRRDKESLLWLQIREKQQALRTLAAEISELKQLLEISIRERDQSSDDDLEKILAEAVDQPLPEEVEEDAEKDSEDHKAYSLLGQVSGPQFLYQ